MRRQIILLALFLSLASAASAGLTSGARILEYPVSARALGMGDAFVGLADDTAAVHFNPAGLNVVPNTRIDLAYFKGLYDTYYTHMGFAMPLGQDAGLGASLCYLDGGKMDLNLVDGTETIVNAEQDIAFTLSGGMRIYGLNMVGLSVTFLHSSLAESFQASTVAFGGGILYDLSPVLHLGMSVKNIGPSLKYDQGADPLPALFTAGLAYDYTISRDHDLNVLLDLRKPLDLDFQVHTGVEYWFRNFIALRAGYQSGHDLDGLTVGAGMMFRFLQMDYAFGLMGDLGSKHHFTLTFAF